MLYRFVTKLEILPSAEIHVHYAELSETGRLDKIAVLKSTQARTQAGRRSSAVIVVS